MEEITCMTSADIDICGQIYFSAFNYYSKFDLMDKYDTEYRGMAESWKNCYDFKKYFGQCIECTDKYAYCVKLNNKVIGFLTGWDIPDITGIGAIYIDIIAIDPKYQKQGYGRKLLLDFFKREGGDKTITLNSKKDIPAYKLYKELDFDENENICMSKSLLIARLDEEYDKKQLLKETL